jgi:hypothetical protein
MDHRGPYTVETEYRTIDTTEFKDYEEAVKEFLKDVNGLDTYRVVLLDVNENEVLRHN